jgi:hypothetical protein
MLKEVVHIVITGDLNCLESAWNIAITDGKTAVLREQADHIFLMFYLQGGYKSLAQKLICAHSVLLLV